MPVLVSRGDLAAIADGAGKAGAANIIYGETGVGGGNSTGITDIAGEFAAIGDFANVNAFFGGRDDLAAGVADVAGVARDRGAIDIDAGVEREYVAAVDDVAGETPANSTSMPVPLGAVMLPALVTPPPKVLTSSTRMPLWGSTPAAVPAVILPPALLTMPPVNWLSKATAMPKSPAVMLPELPLIMPPVTFELSMSPGVPPHICRR